MAEQLGRRLYPSKPHRQIVRTAGNRDGLAAGDCVALAAQTPEAYLRRVARALRPRAVVAGYNHSYGRFGKGDAALLQSLAESLGYEAVIVGPVCVDGEPVSSTRIRALLTEGKKGEAERLAGHVLNAL